MKVDLGRVKFFINGVEKTLLKSTVTKQGERGVDQSKFVIPSNVNAETNCTVEYIHDIVDTKFLKGMWAFDHLAGDESGNANHSIGFSNIPSFVSRWAFECNVIDSGLNNNSLVVCACGTTTYVAGKLGDKAVQFDGCTSFVAGICAESCYDIEHYQRFSGSLWFNPASLASIQALVTKQVSACTVGYSIFFCSTNNNIHFRMSDGSCNFDINTTACSIGTISKWYNITWTFSGTSCESDMKLYVNGELDTNSAACAAISSTVRNNEELTVGAYACGTSKIACGGLIDDLYIFSNKELTAGQSTRLYHEGVLTYGEGKWGDAVTLDGCTAHIIVPDSSDFDLCGKFEAVWWMKAAGSCCVRTVFHKTGGCDTFDFKLNATCKGVLRFGCTTLTSCTDLADCTFHQIRIKRDGSCTLTLAVDNVVEGTGCCVACDETSAVCFTWGRNESKAELFNGTLDSFRWYKGGVLTSCCDTALWVNKNPVMTMAFGGSVTKIEKEISQKTIIAQSHGKVLGETEVEPTQYNCKSPEFIINDMIINNTTLKSVPHLVNSGVTIKKYLADGKLFDLLDDLVSLIGGTFHTHGLEVFHLEKKEFRLKSNIFTHGKNTRIWETHFDDTELVNELTVLGENKRYQEVQTCTSTCGQTVFTLNEAAVSVRVLDDAVEQVPEVDYTLDSLGKTITFCCAPTACSVMQFEYEYEIPLYLKGSKQCSIDTNGIHSKRLVLPWIRDKNDGIRFIAGYLNRYSTIRKNLIIEHPNLVTSIKENDVINVVNAIKNINTTFVVKSLKYEYPRFETTIEVGEYSFDDFEYDKQIAQKIHDLEGAVSTIRELRGFVNPTEIVCITDVVAINTNIEALETLVITDVDCVTEIFDATYDNACTTYDGNDAYT